MFGFKKRTVEEILSAIEKLSDEDREKLRSALNGEMPQEPRRSERLLIAKSPTRTSFLLSPSSVFAAVASCGKMPCIVTDNG